MEGNIRKLAVFVMMAAIAMFIAAATVSADDEEWSHAIRGEYGATGGGVVLVAPFGFNTDMTPVNGVWLINTTSREGDFTFNHDGTGSAESRERVVTLPYQGAASAGSWVDSFDFKYYVTDDGKITITPIPGKFTSTWITGPSKGSMHHVEGASFEGTITPDRKIITLSGGAPEVRTLTPPVFSGFPLQTIYNTHTILIWQQKETPDRD